MSERSDYLRRRAQYRKVESWSLEIPPSERLSKSQLQLLRFFAAHADVALSIEQVQERMRLPRKPTKPLWDLGVDRGLLDEDPPASGNWIVNRAGLELLSRYDALESVKDDFVRSRAAANAQILADAAEEARRARRARRVKAVIILLLLASCIIGMVIYSQGGNP